MSVYKSSDVVIVGGGLAGIAAALMLIENARKDNIPPPSITILEADDRLGGRIKTVQHEGRTINVGAHWFHGGEDNPFWQFVIQRYPDLTYTIDKVDKRLAILKEGIKGNEFREEAFAEFEKTWTQFQQDNPQKDISLAGLQKYIGTDASLNFSNFMATCWMAGASAEQISCRDFFSDPFGPGGIQVKGGNEQIIMRMVDDLRQTGVSIETGKPVTNIRKTPEGVVLTDAEGAQYQAAQTIVTTPLNILQRGIISFDPPLSEKLLETMDGIQTFQMTKVIVPVKEEFFSLNGIKPDTHIDVLTASPQVFCHAYSNGTPALTLFVSGQMAQNLETTPGLVNQFVTNTLRQIPVFNGIENYSDGSLLITSWNSGPFSAGAYTAAKPGHERQSSMNDGPITLAGEGWSRSEQGSGSMSGTFLSAQEAANHVHVTRNAQLAMKPRTNANFDPQNKF